MKRKLLITFLLITIITIITTSSAYALTIVLDPGHGGTGPEAEAVGCENGDLKEREITLKIGLKLRDILNQYEGVNVLMTRQTDTPLTIFERAIFARRNNADLLVSLHINDAESRETSNGVEVWVTHETTHPKYAATHALAQKVVDNISSLGLAKRGETGVRICKNRSDERDIYTTQVRADYYGVIAYSMRGTKLDKVVENDQIVGRDVTWVDTNGNVNVTYLADGVEDTYSSHVEKGEGVPAILIEHCFIYADSQYLDSDEDIAKLAKADADAIISQYNLQLKGQTDNGETNQDDKTKKAEATVINTYKNKYSDIVEKPVIAIRLDNGEITYKEFNEQYPEDAMQISDETEKIKTGDIVKKDNKEYKIVVYGDTDGDGEISIFDVNEVMKHVKEKKLLQGAYLAAADVISYIWVDVKKDIEVDLFSANQILKLVKEKIEYADLIQWK